MVRLGENLRALRHQQGLPQYVVAERAGLTKGMLSAYETDRQAPTLNTLFALAKALEVAPAELLRETDEELSRRLRRLGTLSAAARQELIPILDEYLLRHESHLES